jgi:S-adenosylmethionine:tRNA ribosyltransferase-isomerase
MSIPGNILIKDYSYVLPQEKIAAFPAEKRDGSRLLVYKEGEITDAQFTHLPQHLPPGTVLVLNNTRVIEARILFKKDTGGIIELFCLEPFDQSMEEALARTGSCQWYCLIGGASKWKAGQVLEKKLTVAGQETTFQARYTGRSEDRFIIEFTWQPASLPFAEVLHEAGAIPLPPYIKREAAHVDSERYQTVFNKEQGSVAAPTAALHFTGEILNDLKKNGIDTAYLTLHVGAGTFKPVKAEQIGGHTMHSEPFSISSATLDQLIGAERIVAVGTTSLRTLESLYWLGVKLIRNTTGQEWNLHQWEAYELEPSEMDYRESFGAVRTWMKEQGREEIHCRTSLLIAPGYRFRVPSALVTNFHQPQSTLLLLIAAFIGQDWRRVYDHALANDYRFLSYGDSSLLWFHAKAQSI